MISVRTTRPWWGGRLSKKEEQFSRRWLKISDLLNGMGAIDGLLDPELKNRLRAALDPLAKPAGDDDTRTTGQRYADALETLLCGGRQTHMNGVVNLETLPGGNQPGVLPDGSPIPAEDRKALEVRDRGCVVDGCTIPAAWCQVDHITPWTLGGRADLANLALTCCFHNRSRPDIPSGCQVTHHPDAKITYRILRKNTPALRYRHRRGGQAGGQARDGPDAHAA